MTVRTRYVLLGVGGLALAVVVGLLIALVLRSVTGTPAGPVAGPSSTPTSEAPPAPAAPAPPEPRPEAKENECVDALGDATVDIDSVQLELHDGDLVAQFRFASLPEGDAAFGLNLVRSGNKTYLLGVAVRDGEVDEVFVQDFGRSDIDDLDTDNAVIDGTTVTVVFPRDAIKRIGNDWRWSAFATTSGAEPDTCPDGADPMRFER